MDEQPVTLHIHTSDPKPGGWCSTCVLPSAWTVNLTEIDDHGVTAIGTVGYCPDCGQWTQQAG